MEIRDFQKLMKDLYYANDKERGPEKTLLWIMEEVGELSEGVRMGGHDAIEEEIADLIAWTCSLANLCDIEVERALAKKYPGKCRYCGKLPCECER